MDAQSVKVSGKRETETGRAARYDGDLVPPPIL
jgi:hypothetical protein